MSFIGNVLIVVLLLVLVWIVVYNSWVLTYTYDVLKKICDENVKCGISDSEIRVLQTICIISHQTNFDVETYLKLTKHLRYPCRSQKLYLQLFQS